MSAPILELKDLDVFYGPIQALKKVSMHINEGETVSLIGANGAGKSTLLMSIFGQPRATAGHIVYRGTDITRKSSHYIASNGIAQSPEGRRVFPDMTVEENLMMGTIPIGDKHAAEDMQRMYELFPRLKERRTQRAMTMSVRAADAGDCPGADEPAEVAVAGRALAGAGTDRGQADLCDPA